MFDFPSAPGIGWFFSKRAMLLQFRLLLVALLGEARRCSKFMQSLICLNRSSPLLLGVFLRGGGRPKEKSLAPSVFRAYFGVVDVWGATPILAA